MYTVDLIFSILKNTDLVSVCLEGPPALGASGSPANGHCLPEAGLHPLRSPVEITALKTSVD